MLQSSSETTTTTPTPISPFSSYSGGSEATSDEPPDLGAFTQVFREINHIQSSRPIVIPTSNTQPSTSSLFAVSSSLDSYRTRDSTIWPQRSIASCLSGPSRDKTNSHVHESASLPLSDEEYGSGSDTEGEADARADDIEDLSDLENMDDPPSLGYLDEALSFIAAERARVTAQRDTEKSSLVAESAWLHVVKPQRTRRRKKAKLIQILQKESADGEASNIHLTMYQGGVQDADDSSSSFDQPSSVSASRFKSTPATPSRRKTEKHRQRAAAAAAMKNHRLRHSRSTPSMRLSVTLPLDHRILRLRALAHKLRLLFPEDKASLSSILSNDLPDNADFVDPRGPHPQSQDRLIHVFVDHSNILIGLLNFLKRKLPNTPNTLRHMLHAALALILERGRPITRRVLVTSSPLYQPMDTAEQLGYEVRIYARVPDTGDGQDRRSSIDMSKGHGRKPSSSFLKGHSRKKSGNTSTESETGGTTGTSGSFSRAFVRSLASGSGPTQKSSPTSPTTPIGRGIRYREQGVDELLQLKLHQAIADVDIPPPNATIVLATGDGNVGQFNDDGFLGPVRTALKKGWRVELYAWEDGLSKAWMKEFGEGPFQDRFKIIGLEQFAFDLVQLLDMSPGK